VYELTERDVLGENEDLIDAAIARLRELPSYALESTVEWSAGVARIKVRSKGIAQLDVYLDGRPAGRPVAVDGDETVIEVSAAPDRSHYYRLYGFDERNELVASRRDRFGSGLGVPGRRRRRCPTNRSSTTTSSAKRGSWSGRTRRSTGR
jgi:hypothetical protein